MFILENMQHGVEKSSTPGKKWQGREEKDHEGTQKDLKKHSINNIKKYVL